MTHLERCVAWKELKTSCLVFAVTSMGVLSKMVANERLGGRGLMLCRRVLSWHSHWEFTWISYHCETKFPHWPLAFQLVSGILQGTVHTSIPWCCMVLGIDAIQVILGDWPDTGPSENWKTCRRSYWRTILQPSSTYHLQDPLLRSHHCLHGRSCLAKVAALLCCQWFWFFATMNFMSGAKSFSDLSHHIPCQKVAKEQEKTSRVRQRRRWRRKGRRW